MLFEGGYTFSNFLVRASSAGARRASTCCWIQWDREARASEKGRVNHRRGIRASSHQACSIGHLEQCRFEA